MDVLDVCHIAGLEVVASCNHVKTLKHLGVSKRIPFFSFQSQEFAATSDLPNFLKCTLNLVLKHYVSNAECETAANGN
jgi:hypothetical protein